MKVDLSTFDLENVEKRGGRLCTRRSFVTLYTPSGASLIGGMTLESDKTTEPWHYLIERATSGVCTLRVVTEEFVEMFSMTLGSLPKDATFSVGAQPPQFLLGSPSMSAMLYGITGGGIQPAVKAASVNPDTTALDVPSGHVCAWGDRLPIAQGNIVFINDPGIEVRSYTPEAALPFAGHVYDHMQGPEGALYVFTSAGLFTVSADALGQGQEARGFISKMPAIETSKPLNACATRGAVAVLQRDHVLLLPSNDRIDLSRSTARRYTSTVTDVEDLRQAGAMFSTPRGFIVAFRSRRGFYLDVDLEEKSASWVTGGGLNVVGVLKSRDGEPLIVTSSGVIAPHVRGGSVAGVLRGNVELPEGDRPVVRRVTVSADNPAETSSVVLNGVEKASTTPVHPDDAIIGTSTWSASEKYQGRHTRSRRHSFAVRTSDPTLEITIGGGGRHIDAVAELETNGQGRARRDGGG